MILRFIQQGFNQGFQRLGSLFIFATGLSAAGLFAIGCPGITGDDAGPPDMPTNSCVDCHRPDGVGIEEAHPAESLRCVDCHGGDPTQAEKDAAHILAPEGVGFLKRAPTDILNSIDPSYLQFVNPGDLRVAQVGCGAQNPASGTGGCHQGIVDTNKTSVMTTFVGHYNVPRFLAGIQPDRKAYYGAIDLEIPGWNEATAPEGTVGSIEVLRPPTEEPRDNIQTVMDNYLVKSCSYCHAYSFGRNNAPGTYRSSGCSSCHMLYNNDGLSRSEDPMVDKTLPPHPVKHQLTTNIPVSQCAHCHFQGARIGLLFQGIREGGFDDAVPENAVFLGESLYDHGPDYYIIDEDSTNDVDETPPDLHYSAGMTCVDCHVGTDVHGDGNLYQTAKYQVGIRCQDCHGSVRRVIEEGDDGFFYNAGGSRLKQLSRRQDGTVVVRTKASFGGLQLELPIPQIKDRLDAGDNPRMNAAMAPNGDDWSHADTMECYACHTAYRQTCFGCHVEMDDRFTQTDHQTGQSTQGLVLGRRDFFSIDSYFLGVNHRGKITTVCPSAQIFISYTDADGVKVFDEQVRTTPNGLLGFGWQPNNQHTISKVPQPCTRCHITIGEGNIDDVRATYGFGSGEFFMPDGDGVMHDLSKVLDDEGNPIVEFGHEGVSTVPLDRLQRALGVRIDPSEMGD